MALARVVFEGFQMFKLVFHPKTPLPLKKKNTDESFDFFSSTAKTSTYAFLKLCYERAMKDENRNEMKSR